MGWVLEKKKLPWVYGGLALLLLGGFLTYSLFGPDKELFLVGKTSDGHHQIEGACEACHSEAFGGIEALQQSCLSCHGDELKAVQDSHARSKFNDPRSADMLKALDARYCVTCHQEHRPHITHAVGVTQPQDFCVLCHQDVAEERPSHKGMAFTTCANSGCHNYHDNTTLYEDFLIKHRNEPDLLRPARVPERNLRAVMRRTLKQPMRPLSPSQQNAPASVQAKPELVKEWAQTSHARTGVNCGDCHNTATPVEGKKPWQDQPGNSACMECHQGEKEGFQAGKHGMRLPHNLGPMRPGMARLPMKEKARDKELGCTSCHRSHDFDTREAAVDACLTCHNDNHSRAFRDSPHYRLWQLEVAGYAQSGTGVSCATCHLPRTQHAEATGAHQIRVEHNQNLNLRPNSKMARNVCMQCHGLSFSLDALADESLIGSNFAGKPAHHVESLDMALKRFLKKSK